MDKVEWWTGEMGVERFRALQFESDVIWNFRGHGGGLHLPTPSASFTDFVGQIGHCSQAVNGFARFQRVAAEQTDMWGAYALPSACGMGLESVVMQASIPNEQHDGQQHCGTDRDTETQKHY
jgi:hypothetical protein